MNFKLVSDFKPTGDQPEAIDNLVKSIEKGNRGQVLLGVTGSGKTFTVAENMNNKGTVISCDIYSQRTDLIKNGAERLGLNCVKTEVNDASVFNEAFPKADRVLCDVPCSGLGIITKKPEIKYKKLDDAKSLLPIQKEILNASSKYVKSGGKLVYSTCSINPNENRKICDAFLKENPDFSSIKAFCVSSFSATESSAELLATSICDIY